MRKTKPQPPKPFRRPPRAERASGVVSVRYSPAERADVERLASAAGIDLSVWIRQRSLTVSAYDDTHARNTIRTKTSE